MLGRGYAGYKVYPSSICSGEERHLGGKGGKIEGGMISKLLETSLFPFLVYRDILKAEICFQRGGWDGKGMWIWTRE